MNRKTASVAAAVTALMAVAGLVAVTLTVFPATGAAVTTASGRTGEVVQCGFSLTCSADNPSGMILAFSVNSTVIAPNGSFEFRVSEYNPTDYVVNMALANDWPLSSLQWPCNSGAIPYGLAAFRGYYTLSNVSSAMDALHFAPYLCLSYAPPSDFVFQPLSGFSPAYTPGFIQIYATGGDTTSSGNSTMLVSSLGSSAPGTYTLAAGDEWGDLVLLHITVSLTP